MARDTPEARSSSPSSMETRDRSGDSSTRSHGPGCGRTSLVVRIAEPLCPPSAGRFLAGDSLQALWLTNDADLFPRHPGPAADGLDANLRHAFQRRAPCKYQPVVIPGWAVELVDGDVPAAIVFIVGDRRTLLSEASAQYALANMAFTAQVLGVGSCLWGNGPIFVSRSRAGRRLLGLQRRERIFGALFLGYPAVRFRNKV